MASFLKRQLYEYRDGTKKDPSFESYVTTASDGISTPIENSFIHINGTAPDIVNRSNTISKPKTSTDQLKDEADCIVINNSRFYSSVNIDQVTDIDKSGEYPDSEETVPDGISSPNNPNKFKLDLSFRDTILRKPVRGSSLDCDELNLDADSPDVSFCHTKLSLQKVVAEKYKLGELVEEMDDRFFDMTEDEKTYQLLNQSRNNCSDSLSLFHEDTNLSIGPSLAHRTPPPPPKPSRKNSQKRTANNESGSDNHEDDFL